jgi:hypothetical protein
VSEDLELELCRQQFECGFFFGTYNIVKESTIRVELNSGTFDESDGVVSSPSTGSSLLSMFLRENLSLSFPRYKLSRQAMGAGCELVMIWWASCKVVVRHSQN